MRGADDPDGRPHAWLINLREKILAHRLPFFIAPFSIAPRHGDYGQGDYACRFPNYIEPVPLDHLIMPPLCLMVTAAAGWLF